MTRRLRHHRRTPLNRKRNRTMKRILITAALLAATSSAASAGSIRHEFNVCFAQVWSDYMACAQHSALQECLVTFSDANAACQDKATADQQRHPENW
jgi:hypothetical protein